jgi:glycosyltransferase involved in cell wall biosynthesis
MFLSTIVISYNRKELTKYFIDSYNATTPKGSGELIVVDNASTNGAIEYLKKAKDQGLIQKLILNKKNNFIGKAWNQGFEISDPKADYIGKFDNDHYFENGWYENFLNIIKITKNPEAVITTYSPKKHDKKQVKNLKYLQIKGDIGACYYLNKDFIKKHNILFKPVMKMDTARNKQILDAVRKKNGKVFRLMPPYVTREKERYSDPKYEQYYKETFGSRGLLREWEKRAAKERQK